MEFSIKMNDDTKGLHNCTEERSKNTQTWYIYSLTQQLCITVYNDHIIMSHHVR